MDHMVQAVSLSFPISGNGESYERSVCERGYKNVQISKGREKNLENKLIVQFV